MEVKPEKVMLKMKFYITEDIVKILNVTPYTVRAYLRNEKIKSIKIGGRFYVSEANLKAFLGGGRFWDQSNDKIMDSINTAIKLTFESNVKWLAFEVKKLIIDDLTKNFRDNLEEINRIAGIPKMEDRAKVIKKEFEKV
jgi:hypothetical protein